MTVADIQQAVATRCTCADCGVILKPKKGRKGTRCRSCRAKHASATRKGPSRAGLFSADGPPIAAEHVHNSSAQAAACRTELRALIRFARKRYPGSDLARLRV